jgi:hypothetical protein
VFPIVCAGDIGDIVIIYLRIYRVGAPVKEPFGFREVHQNRKVGSAAFLLAGVLTTHADSGEEKKSSDFFEIGGVRQKPVDEKNSSGVFESERPVRILKKRRNRQISLKSSFGLIFEKISLIAIHKCSG